jgi:hypothetical protein
MIETLALAAGVVFLVGIGLSVMIAELLRKRDAREADLRAAVARKTVNRRLTAASSVRPAELTPAAAAELAIRNRQASLAPNGILADFRADLKVTVQRG